MPGVEDAEDCVRCRVLVLGFSVITSGGTPPDKHETSEIIANYKCVNFLCVWSGGNSNKFTSISFSHLKCCRAIFTESLLRPVMTCK